MKRSKTHIIILTAIIAAIIFTLYIAFHNSKERIKNEINYAFKEAITKDYNDRLAYISYYHPEPTNWDIKMYALAPVLDRKVKEYTIRTKKGKTIYTFKDSLNEQIAKPLLNQYILSQLKPIKANELNSVFQTILPSHNVTGTSGTTYYNKQALQYSNNDSIIPPSAHCTPRYTLDIAQDIRVQAWVDYNLATILKHIDNTIFWIVGQFIIVAAILIFYRKEKTSQTTFHQMLIDLEKQELSIDGTPCNIQKLDLTLLNILYQKTGLCISRDEIKQTFWPTDDNANEKIDAHIKAIRKVLKDFPDYKLVTVRGKGYYLSTP